MKTLREGFLGRRSRSATGEMLEAPQITRFAVRQVEITLWFVLLASLAGQSCPARRPLSQSFFMCSRAWYHPCGWVAPSLRSGAVGVRASRFPASPLRSETGLQPSITLRVKSSLAHLAQRTMHALSLLIQLLNINHHLTSRTVHALSLHTTTRLASPPTHTSTSHHGQCTHCPYSSKTKNRDSNESRFLCKSVYQRFNLKDKILGVWRLKNRSLLWRKWGFWSRTQRRRLLLN